MEKLKNKILIWCKTKPYHIIFSTANTPAEGEHKLLQFIRDEQKKKNYMKYVIYGLDADLIFLALSTNCKQMYLLREAVNFNKKSEEELNLVCIDTMKKCIVDTIKNKIKDTLLQAKKELIVNPLDNDIINLKLSNEEKN